MGSYCVICFVASAACFLLAALIRRKIISHKLLLPPSPPAWPVIGHLHILHRPLHQSLHKLAQVYGSILHLRLGCMPTVVISSPEWAKEFLHAHGRDFSDRPQFEASKRLFYGGKTVVMMEHGPMWRDLRKLYTVQILTLKRIEMFELARHKEMALALHLIECQLSNNINQKTPPIEIRQFVFNTVGNMMTSMLFSKRSFDHHRQSRFKEMVLEMAVLFGAPIIGDLIPCLSWLDIQGYKKRMDSLAKDLDTFLEEVVMERLDSRDHGPQEKAMDFLDLLISIYKGDGEAGKESIKSILLDLLSAGTETSTTTVEWAMAELLRNPQCMKKLQEELNTVNQAYISSLPDTRNDKDYNINDDSKIKLIAVGDADIPKLNYLQAVIKETLRLHPPLPLVVRQMSKSLENGKEVGGYKLPRKTRLLVNLWAMGRDTKVWGVEADTFHPDRFMGSLAPADLRGQHFEFLPFGSGRRGCPGMNLGLAMVGLVLANLIHSFNWKLPDSHHTLDLSEASSRTAPMANPLVALPTRRHT